MISDMHGAPEKVYPDKNTAKIPNLIPAMLAYTFSVSA